MTSLVAGFAVALVLWTAVSLYLSLRQSAFVAENRDSVPSDFAAGITLDEHRKAADYTRARERLSRRETVVDAAVTLAWAFGGINLVYGAVSAFVGPSLTRGVCFLIATAVVSTIVALPFDIYRTFRLEKTFGFNRTNPLTFLADRVKGAAISLAVTVPMLFILLWFMRTLTGLWWLYAWLGFLVLMFAAPSFYVRVVAPRFNRFEPLTDLDLRGRIERLLDHSGFRSSGLFVMDASRRTARGNAYFIGFGRTKRIVLFDTLVQRSTPEEIEAVVAHELGHFLHRHVLFGLVRGAVMLFGVLAVIGWLSKQPWLLPSFGVSGRDDALALFVCMLLVGVVSPILAPLSNWISRRNEYEADDYARRTVGAAPMASALIKLARDNASTLTPDPLYALVHHSHPSVPQRVQHLRTA